MMSRRASIILLFLAGCGASGPSTPADGGSDAGAITGHDAGPDICQTGAFLSGGGGTCDVGASCTTEYELSIFTCTCPSGHWTCSAKPHPSDICEQGRYCHPDNGGCTAQTSSCERRCVCPTQSGPGEGNWVCAENCDAARSCPASAIRTGDRCTFDAGFECRTIFFDRVAGSCLCEPSDAGNAWACDAG
jgi:hypothetical protein